ncbi:hypothetical protein BDB01DRAFT_836043 [Pilobolus umbonatus]|nr:hypothetical protein BDB01DRAFT_836043 [Pilobolus umbonatus]
MSFNIPGYYLDQTTGKLFRIAKEGPYSLPELRKKIAAEEKKKQEEEEAKSTKTKRYTPHSYDNVLHYLQQRSLYGSHPTRHSSYLKHNNRELAIVSLLKQLDTTTQIKLDKEYTEYKSTVVATTQNTDGLSHGEVLMTTRSGVLHHLAYQLSPSFQMWGCHAPGFQCQGVTSLHLMDHHHSSYYQTMTGTSGDKVWRYHIPRIAAFSSVPPPQLLLDENGNLKQNIVPFDSFYHDNMDAYGKACNEYKHGKDRLWTSAVNKDKVMLGSDTAIIQLTEGLDHVRSRKIKSAVFAIELPASQPHHAWFGTRNKCINIYDEREKVYHTQFMQTSSISTIKSLDSASRPYQLLSTAFDGSVFIWDIRMPHTNTKAPYRQLRGHVNEYNQNLGMDIDTENKLFMQAGDDGRVRIWSLMEGLGEDPVWTSKQYSHPIPAAKFYIDKQFPAIHESWNDTPYRNHLHQTPGIMLYGVTDNTNRVSIDWLSTLH